MAWCCETTGHPAPRAASGSPSARTRREKRPDGSRISWRVAGREAGLGARPFYIAWDEPGMRPGLLAAPHAVEVQGIRRLEVGCSAEELQDRVVDVPVQPLGDGGGLRAVVIATADGEIRLTGDS